MDGKAFSVLPIGPTVFITPIWTLIGAAPLWRQRREVGVSMGHVRELPAPSEHSDKPYEPIGQLVEQHTVGWNATSPA